MSDQTTITVEGRQFTWDRNGYDVTGSAMLTDLGVRDYPKRVKVAGRWATREFYLVGGEKSPEGELLSMTYDEIPETFKRQVDSDYHLVIFND